MPLSRRSRRGFAALHQHVKIGVWKPAGHQRFKGAEQEVHPVHGLVRLALHVYVAERLLLPEGHCAMRRTIGRAYVFRVLVIFGLLLANVISPCKQLP